MSDDLRTVRLQTDLATLAALRAASTIFDFQEIGNQLDHYLLKFAGRGLGPLDIVGRPAVVEFHEIELQLDYNYPQSPPIVQWITPLLHPNVAESGAIDLAATRLQWTPGCTIDVVVQHLWDIARGAAIHLSQAVNDAARPWYEPASPLTLPLDDRPLRTAGGAGSNIVRYRRTGEQWQWPLAEGVLFIGDEAMPNLPPPVDTPARDEVLYIGPDA